MSGIIEHQMKRAAPAAARCWVRRPWTSRPWCRSCALRCSRFTATRTCCSRPSIAAGAQFIGDRADLTELLGNLLDNACKWSRSRVRSQVTIDAAADSRAALRADHR